MCDIVFDKVEGRRGTVNRVPPKRFFKKVLRKISQKSQKNTCAGVSYLIKLDAVDLQLH